MLPMIAIAVLACVLGYYIKNKFFKNDEKDEEFGVHFILQISFFCLTEFSHASSYEHPYYKIKKLMKNLSLEWVFQHRKPIRDGLTTVSSILSSQFIKEIPVD